MVATNQILKLANYFLALSEDINLAMTPEQYQECMNDPDCFSKYRMDSASRFKAYHSRQQQNPSTAYLERRKTYQSAKKILRESGSLEGFASSLSQKIQTIKSELAKKIKTKVTEQYKLLPESEQTSDRWKLEVESFPAYKEFVQDSKDLYYLRDKTREFATVLDGSNLLLTPIQKKMIKQLKSLSTDILNKYGNKYKSLAGIIQNIISKLDSY